MRISMGLRTTGARGRPTLGLLLSATALTPFLGRWLDLFTWNDNLTWSDGA